MINPKGYRYRRPPHTFYTIFSNSTHNSNAWITQLKKAFDTTFFPQWSVSFYRIWKERENISLDFISTPYPSPNTKLSYAALLAEDTATIFSIPFIPLFQPHSHSHRHRIQKYKNHELPKLLDNPPTISGKTILLIDDIIFTGNTLKNCLKTIQEKGGYGFAMAVSA